MSPRLQKLVYVQIEVNRAVFEANQTKPRDKFINERILQAQIELSAAMAIQPRPKSTMKRRSGMTPIRRSVQ